MMQSVGKVNGEKKCSLDDCQVVPSNLNSSLRVSVMVTNSISLSLSLVRKTLVRAVRRKKIQCRYRRPFL